MRGKALSLLVCAVICACSETPRHKKGPNYFPTEVHSPGTLARGGMGYLSPREADYFQYLAWPQSYADMKGTFGLANRSTNTADIYLIESSGQEVWVFYEGAQAIGYEVR